MLATRLQQLTFWSRKYYRRAIQLFGSHLYFNPNPDIRKSILVAGTARSGTTWLGDLIASQIPSRILFEPFNPDLVSDYRHFHYFQYLRPGTENPEFYAFAQKIFTGKIRNGWIDRQNERIFSKFRLVKEIRANLALKWLHDNFPEVPIILIVRHPCAVVLSRMELGWATDHDIEPFLSQPQLVEDYLGPYMNLIRSAKNSEEKHAVIWSISNLVPLKQFRSGELKVVYYEDLCTQPEMELPGIFEAIGCQYSGSLITSSTQPSQTTRRASAVVTGTNKIGNWKKKLSPTQIDNILQVVQAFGLGHLYGESALPLNKTV
jgi:sulfotransferase family protein